MDDAFLTLVLATGTRSGVEIGGEFTSSVVAVVPAPVNIDPPAISGTALIGQTLSANHGVWSNSPTSYAYQWRAGGVAISGATSSTFLLTSAQSGALITVSVTAANAGGSSTATSGATAAVLNDVYFVFFVMGQY